MFCTFIMLYIYHVLYISSALIDCLVFPIQSKKEEWKKCITSLDKEHSKEFKKVRQSIKRKTEQIMKLRKRARKETSSSLNKKIEKSMQELHNQYQVYSMKQYGCLLL